MFIQTLEISCSKAIEKDIKDSENIEIDNIFKGSLNLVFLIFVISVAKRIKTNTQNKKTGTQKQSFILRKMFKEE